MWQKVCAVYIITNKWNTTFYVGVTSDLPKRIWKHRNKVDPKSFSARYNLTKLVWYETTPNILSAIDREKQLKAGSRNKKISLIQAMNPEWRDLWPELIPGNT